MKLKEKCLTAILVAFLANVSVAQFSIGFNAGYASNADPHEDAFALDDPSWPTPTSSGDKAIVFYENGTGFSKSIFVTWEASNLFGISLVYRNINFEMSEAKRKATNNSLGVWLKLNFRSHEKKFVPFIQAEYMFYNSHTLHQDQATGLNGQAQPEFDLEFKGNLGVGGDLGFEIGITDALYAQILGGVHGIQITGDVDASFPTYTGTNIEQPSNIDGTFFLQFSGGLKFYLSKRKKKRDF